VNVRVGAGTGVTPADQATANGLSAGPAGAGSSLIRVRRAAPADHEALREMFGRCTLGTRYGRFHGPVRAIPERYLADALSGSAFHHALIAWHRPVPFPYGNPGASDAASAASPAVAVALASCRTVEEGAAELGLLVEDAWQGQGLGTRLLRDLVTHASRAGLRVLEAQVLAEQAWIARLLKPYGTCRLRSATGGVLNLTVRLDQ